MPFGGWLRTHLVELHLGKKRLGFSIVRKLAIVSLGWCVTACVFALQPEVHSSVVPSGPASAGKAGIPTSAVRISATQVPDGAAKVGVVEAHVVMPASIMDLIPVFAARVAGVGGDFGKIDQITTKFEMIRTIQSQSYDCGSPSHPMTCTRLYPVVIEVGTTSVLGRAFSLPGGVNP